MTTTQDADSTVSTPTSIDDTDSPYTTQGEDVIEVDTSSGAVTVTLATADVDAGRVITIIDDGGNASSNNITIDTEGSETIDPDGDSSKSITTDHAAFAFEANGTNWNQVNANQEVERIAAGRIDIADRILTADDFLAVQSMGVVEPPSDTASTSYTDVGEASGVFDLGNMPPGCTAYGRFTARFANDTGGETTTVRPRVQDVGNNFTGLSELEVSKTGTGVTPQDSGWVELTSIASDDFYVFSNIQAKVTGGTSDFGGAIHGLSIGWRID